MLLQQPINPEGEEGLRQGTQAIIDTALKHGGRYDLAYRLHATADQFARAYPQGEKFFALKRKYDPEQLFQNLFYRKYGGPLQNE